MNKNPFAHHLFIYDDKMIFKTRVLFKHMETTISYNHVSQVNLINELLFSHLEIINTGVVENIFIKYVGKRAGKEAKKVIDQKIHHTHARTPQNDQYSPHNMVGESNIQDIEKSLIRLNELLARGSIDRAEYNKRRSSILKGKL